MNTNEYGVSWGYLLINCLVFLVTGLTIGYVMWGMK